MIFAVSNIMEGTAGLNLSTVLVGTGPSKVSIDRYAHIPDGGDPEGRGRTADIQLHAIIFEPYQISETSFNT
jgi:hypothetical protein